MKADITTMATFLRFSDFTGRTDTRHEGGIRIRRQQQLADLPSSKSRYANRKAEPVHQCFERVITDVFLRRP